MKCNLVILGLAAVSLVSCSVFDPDYAAYKDQQKTTGAQATGGDPYSSVANPYGVPANTPQPAGEVGRYQPDPATAPYQPLPGVPANNPGGAYAIPSAGGSGGTAPAPARVQTHVVTQGDSLWGISRKYGASVAAIRAANSIDGNLIRVGQTLQIPR